MGTCECTLARDSKLLNQASKCCPSKSVAAPSRSPPPPNKKAPHSNHIHSGDRGSRLALPLKPPPRTAIVNSPSLKRAACEHVPRLDKTKGTLEDSSTDTAAAGESKRATKRQTRKAKRAENDYRVDELVDMVTDLQLHARKNAQLESEHRVDELVDMISDLQLQMQGIKLLQTREAALQSSQKQPFVPPLPSLLTTGSKTQFKIGGPSALAGDTGTISKGTDAPAAILRRFERKPTPWGLDDIHLGDDFHESEDESDNKIMWTSPC